jgi:hypothetical protein
MRAGMAVQEGSGGRRADGARREAFQAAPAAAVANGFSSAVGP